MTDFTTDAEISGALIRNQSAIAGFWPRLTAFLIDSILMGLIGIILISLFFDFFAQLGAWGRLVGFCIAFLYFGGMNSALFGGQTVGKRIMGIKVASSDGELLSPAKASLRYMVLATLFFLNNAAINIDADDFAMMSLTVLLALVVFGVGASNVYLFIFNKKTRQALHDLLVGSYVVRKDSGFVGQHAVWRGHYVIVSLLLVTAVGSPMLILSKAEGFLSSNDWQGLRSANRALANLPDVSNSTLSVQKTSQLTPQSSNASAEVVLSNVMLNKDRRHDENFANGVARIIMQKYPTVVNKDPIIIGLHYGNDIGIASMWRSKSYQYTPDEWKKRLRTY